MTDCEQYIDGVFFREKCQINGHEVIQCWNSTGDLYTVSKATNFQVSNVSKATNFKLLNSDLVKRQRDFSEAFSYSLVYLGIARNVMSPVLRRHKMPN